MERHIRNFFYGIFNEGKHLLPISWPSICKPAELGGLNLKSIVQFAESAQLRQVWILASKTSTIWTAWAYGKYVKNKSFWELKIPSNCSWGWHGILKNRSKALKHSQHIIGDGRKNLFLV